MGLYAKSSNDLIQYLNRSSIFYFVCFPSYSQARNELFSDFAKQVVSKGVRDYSQIPELKYLNSNLIF